MQMDVQWCNGSTTGFGSVCGGSNPPWTTKSQALPSESLGFFNATGEYASKTF